MLVLSFALFLVGITIIIVCIQKVTNCQRKGITEPEYIVPVYNISAIIIIFAVIFFFIGVNV